MYFVTAEGMRPAPLTRNPFNALVMPRPIGWISTVSAAGIANLAPFSYFNAVSADPPFVMFAPNAAGPGSLKDTLVNLREVPEFVVNLVSESHGEMMNASSGTFPSDVDEFDACGIEKRASNQVRPPSVASAPASLECRVYETVSLPVGSDARESHVVIGEVVGIHIDDDMIVDGLVDERRLAPLTRLGYMNYGTLGEIFVMDRP